MREKLKRWHHINWAEHVNDKDGAGNLRQQLFETPWVERELERRLEQDAIAEAARESWEAGWEELRAHMQRPQSLSRR